MSPVDNRVFYLLTHSVTNKSGERVDMIINWNKFYNPFGINFRLIWDNVGQKILKGANDETNKSLLRN